MRRIVAAKASPTRDDKPTPDAVIEIAGQLPDFEDLARARGYFRDEAEAIYAALGAALPGGTIDALFGVMALDRATLFHVTHRAPATAKPEQPADAVAPGEVRGRLDASDYQWQQADDVVGALGAIREALIALVHATATTSRGPSPIPVSDDDVPDVYIHEATCEHRDGCTACVRELRAQRAAALALHTRVVWSGMCAGCSHDDREVPYPCGTARALGVPAVDQAGRSRGPS